MLRHLVRRLVRRPNRANIPKWTLSYRNSFTINSISARYSWTTKHVQAPASPAFAPANIQHFDCEFAPEDRKLRGGGGPEADCTDEWSSADPPLLNYTRITQIYPIVAPVLHRLRRHMSSLELLLLQPPTARTDRSLRLQHAPPL
jgi:hypothetical protein